MTELTAHVTNKKPDLSYIDNKVLQNKTKLRKMPEPETYIKKAQSDKTVYWKDNESGKK